MRLQSLEIKGFKSFPDKTIVNFDNKITGIVGPNGCGKSNIIDAIRWVVGEQKIANLRSENLESLVFNGSKTRTSSGLAEVTLTFENTKNILPVEYNIVSITRRFYKTGDSEYRLNDVQCRLKDIQNLLLDTGIGSDSYSIIELGMVDDLIKDKDNSRRKLLEQAAGITIYKIRKKEAKQKLDLTETDLSRIEDVLFEVGEQMKSLESQAKKAEKHNEFKTEYKQYSIEYAKLFTKEFNETLQSISKEIEQIEYININTETEIDKTNALIENLKLQNIEIEQELQKFQKEFNDLLNTINFTENDKKLFIQKNEHLNDKINNIKSTLLIYENQLKQLNESIQLNQTQIEEQELNLNNFNNDAIIQKEKLENAKNTLQIKKDSLENFRNENKKWQIQQFDLEKKIAISITSLTNIEQSVLQISNEIEKRKNELKNINIQKQEFEIIFSQKQNELQNFQEINKKIKEDILQSQQEIEIIRENLNKENRILDAKKNEYELLKSVVEKMEGYPESVKFLFNNTNWVNRQVPILSDIIYVQSEYRVTIENFLENYLNHYIVDNKEEAVLAIELLFNNQKGKASFFILNEFENIIQHQNLNLNNLIYALDVLEIENKYKPLFKFILGNLYISNIDKINTKDYPENIIILDKKGSIIYNKNVISGGSVGLFEGNKIGRVKNLEKLKETINIQTEIVNKLKTEFNKLHQEIINKNGAIKENEIIVLQNKINQLSNEKYSLDNKIDNLTTLNNSETKKIEELQKTKLQYEESNLLNTNSLDLVKIEFEKNSEQVKLSLVEFEKLSQEYTILQDLHNQTTLTFSQKQNYLNSLKQEYKFKLEQIENLNSSRERNKEEKEKTEIEIKKLKTQIEETEIKIINYYITKENQNKNLIELEILHDNLKKEIFNLENQLKQHFKTKEINNNKTSELKDKKTEIKIQLSTTKERLNVEFGIVLEDLIEENTNLNLTQNEIKVLIDKTKKRIENLGEINPMAIEAYNEIKNRYENISTQKQDILNAKTSLLQTIQEVEVTANQKFLTTFNTVKDNFRKVFKSLFTEEDECDLVLENPENLAETGVNILAKPKGKRPSSINQLSGGEKTLTATALLFAIYLIKPAPFCILDEVDAPLDDNNVSKFTNMIKTFSNESQFIIVTHNKTTMSTVDVIYGVTMQEFGVSKLVPVDFRSLA